MVTPIFCKRVHGRQRQSVCVVGGVFPNENLAPEERRACACGMCTDVAGIHVACPAFKPLHGVTQGDNVRGP